MLSDTISDAFDIKEVLDELEHYRDGWGYDSKLIDYLKKQFLLIKLVGIDLDFGSDGTTFMDDEPTLKEIMEFPVIQRFLAD